jgi:RNA polymerase sigma-70 factor (ECF subfamily)
MPARFDLLYDQHADALFAFLLSVTGNEGDSRDALQEVFVKIARRPDLLEGINDERAFLFRLARNVARDLFRRRATRTDYEARFASETYCPFAPAEDPAEDLFQKDLAAALAELPLEQREVVHLKLWEKFTFEAIGQALEIPANTAASRYRYAIAKLRERLVPLYEEQTN